MELRHLRYFTAVAEETTHVGAAKRLGVAQPALTRQIHALERELDVELLERGPKGAALTPAGEVVHASARHVISQVDAAVERARAASRGLAGRAVLCTGVRALASGFVARILARLGTQYPDIDLGVIEGTFQRQFRTLQVGEADIGIGVPPPPAYPDLASETLHLDVFGSAVIAEAHPLSRRSSLEIRELARETFISWGGEAASEIRRLIKREFKRAGFAPAATREFDDSFAVGSAVAAGQGWTLIPDDVYSLAPPGTAVVPLTDFKLPLPHALVWRANEQRPVVRTVMDVIRQLAAEERGILPSETPSSLRTGDLAQQKQVAPSSLLELRHLRYFCAVVDAGTFGRAAEELELTQPALSRQIGDLERVVGAPLLDRSARGVKTTAAGASLRRSARRLLDEVGTIHAEAQRARRGATARCLIAAVPTSSARGLITALVRDCAREAPHLELHFEDLATPAQPGALREGLIDLGVCHASSMGAFEQRGIERTHLTTDRANCALVSAANPLAQHRRLWLRQLAELPFLFSDRDFQPGMYDDVFGQFERNTFEPRVEATYNGFDTVWSLVAQDRGWTLGFASQCDAPPLGTRSIPLEGFDLPWGLDLLAREDESRSLILDVADRLRRVASAMS